MDDVGPLLGIGGQISAATGLQRYAANKRVNAKASCHGFYNTREFVGRGGELFLVALAALRAYVFLSLAARSVSTARVSSRSGHPHASAASAARRGVAVVLAVVVALAVVAAVFSLVAVVFAALPRMREDRFLFNALWTLWIFVGATLEERDLVSAFGADYLRYRKSVPMLIPWRAPTPSRAGLA